MQEQARWETTASMCLTVAPPTVYEDFVTNPNPQVSHLSARYLAIYIYTISNVYIYIYIEISLSLYIYIYINIYIS